MMAQLNLLPDVKMEYIKAQRARRLVVSLSVIITIAALALLLLLLSVDGLQKKHLSDLARDIKSESTKLQNEPQIGRILTVQNQLKSLTALHANEPAAGQLFEDLNEVTPTNVNITDFRIDFNQHTITLTGTSANLANVNQFIDTLKHTTYTTGSAGSSTSSPQPAFSNVVLSNFSLNTSTNANSNQAANYTINLSYNQAIFSITQPAHLSVSDVPTRSQSQQNQAPDLFQNAPQTNGGSQ